MTGLSDRSRVRVGGSTLKTRFYSHATLESKDIGRTRRFFSEFLGFEIVAMGEAAFWARLGGKQIIVVVQSVTKTKHSMPFLNHNGLDVGSEQEVDAAHELVRREAAEWGLHKISRPVAQHGTYSFYFWDMDDNAWEILSNPEGGYSWAFDASKQNTPNS